LRSHLTKGEKMKTTKILRRTRSKLSTTELLESNQKISQTVVSRRSLRPMKSMMGVKSLKPTTLSEQFSKRKSAR
jgi:hypothetical protein